MDTAPTTGGPPSLSKDIPTAASGTRRKVRALRLLAWMFAVVPVGLGVLALYGWHIRDRHLPTAISAHVTMKPDTAVGFILCGLALAGAMVVSPIVDRLARRASVLASTLVGLLGVLTAVEYLFHVNLRIDQMVFVDSSQQLYPGRMASTTALCFCLAAVSLILLMRGSRARVAAQMTAILLLVIAFSGTVTYLYGVTLLNGPGGTSSMALLSGVSFLVLGSGILLAAPQSRLVHLLSADETGGWLVRRVLPAIVAVPVLLGWLYLRPAMDMGGLRFGMALLSVSLAVIGVATLLTVAIFLNRVELERAAMARERTLADEAVQQSERDLRLVTDHLPTLISYISPDGRLLRVNRTYERWFGRPAAEIAGSRIIDLLGEDYWNRSAPYREAALRGQDVSYETTYPTVSGDRRVQITYAPDFDPTPSADGGSLSVRGLACMVLDVEEHRRAEAALLQNEKLAVVGRLASSIAHEINNPLEAVTNLLYLAGIETGAMGSERSPIAHGYVEQAQQELARVTQIVVQTLRFHRQATVPTRCRVADLLDQILVLYQGRLAQAHIVVERDFRESTDLLCREGELRQVLANLIGNAADALTGANPSDSTGGRHLILRTRSTARGVRVTVADTGHGIAPEARKNLFQPFHTTKGDTGSGLGLWVSKEIILRHGGRISVRSRPPDNALVTEGRPSGCGTIFCVFLPYRSNMDGVNASVTRITTEVVTPFADATVSV